MACVHSDVRACQTEYVGLLSSGYLDRLRGQSTGFVQGDDIELAPAAEALIVCLVV